VTKVLGHPVYIQKIFYISHALLHVSMDLHHLQEILSFYFVKVTKIIKIVTLMIFVTYDT